MGPFNGGSNMGPFSGAQNMGPFSNNNNMDLNLRNCMKGQNCRWFGFLTTAAMAVEHSINIHHG
jgi:hypothetical protein